MIKFFRKVRQTMIKENRVSKYMLYAIGEIVLVVIGILIALSINDWNDNRKNVAFEHDMLLLIDRNLQKDAETLQAEMWRTAQAMTLTDRLVEQVARENFNDSLNIWMGKIITFERFKSQSSAFEVLKAKGIENVRDKELQLALITYYDESLFQLYESINDVVHAFKTDWIPVIKQDFTDFKWMEYCEPVNQREFLEKRTSIVLFKLYKDNRAGQLRRMESALGDIDHIRSLIKHSLR